MKKLFFFGVIAMSMIMTSCVSLNKSYDSSAVKLTNVKLDPIKADLTVDQTEKLVGTSSSSFFWIFKVSGDNSFADGVKFPGMSFGAVNKVKSSAAYNALNNAEKEYDIIVDPQYTVKVTKTIFTTNIKVTVEGYGGTYSNFRTEREKIVILDGGKEIILQDR
jgi:hypothetical protein